jgi:hypothetical protein
MIGCRRVVFAPSTNKNREKSHGVGTVRGGVMNQCWTAPASGAHLEAIMALTKVTRSTTG